MDLRKEESKSRNNKRMLSEIDVSEWGITSKKFIHVRENEVATLARSTLSSKVKLALRSRY
jgi:hypothetical protein